MEPDDLSQHENLSEEQVSLLNVICADFKQKIRQNDKVSIEDTVDSAPEAIRPALLKELISIEVNWMNESGTLPSKETYVERFPNLKDSVDEAFFGFGKNDSTSAESKPGETKKNESIDQNTHDPDKEYATRDADHDLTMDADKFDVSIEPGNTLIFSDSPDEDGPFNVSQGSSDEESGTTDFKTSNLNDNGKSENQNADAVRENKTGIYSSSTLKESQEGKTRGLLVPVYGNDKRYLIESEIDRGGMGVVLKVRDLHLDRILAMKVVRGRKPEEERPSQTPSADRLARFVREASVTSRLDHPGVVPVHEMGKDEQGRLFFTMKLVRGQTLSKVVKDFKAGTSSWTRARILEVLVRVCDTIAFAHSNGVIHRDLKPANIMVGDFGEAYVMDWGLAKVIDDDKTKPDAIDELADRTLEAQYGSRAETLDGSIMGTPHYMPPEQALGMPKDMDEKCDIYSLGAMLYEILTGKKPYAEHKGAINVLKAVCGERPDSIREIEPKAPNELVAIAEKAMQKEKEDRYSSASELSHDIRAFLDNRVVSAYRTGALAQLEKWTYRNRTLVTITLALSFVGMAMFAYFQAEKYQLEVKTTESLEGLNIQLNESNDKLSKTNGDLQRSLKEEERAKNRLWGRSLVQSSESLIANGGDTTLAAMLVEQAINTYHYDTIDSRTALYSAAELLNERNVLRGHTGAVERAIFSPDERLLATCSFDGTCIIWDVKAGRQKSLIINSQKNRVLSVQFSKSGKQILVSGGFGSLGVWDTETGDRISAFQVGVRGSGGYPFGVIAASFLDDESKVVAVMRNGNVFLVDLKTGDVPYQVLFPAKERRSVSEVQISPDRTKLVTGFDDGRVSVIGIENSKLDLVLQTEPTAEKAVAKVKSIHFSNDGKYFTVAHQSSAGDSSSPLEVRNAEDGQLWKTVSLAAGISSARFLPDSNHLIMGVSNGERSFLAVWDCEKDKQIGKSVPFQNPARKLAASKDGSSLVTVSGPSGLGVWNISKAWKGTYSIEHSQNLNGHLRNQRTTGVGITSDGRIAFSTSTDQTARVWQLDGPRAVQRLGLVDWAEGSLGSHYFRFRKDGKRMLSLCRDRESGILWQLPEMTKVAELDFGASGNNARFVPGSNWFFSGDDKYVLAAVDSKELLVWSSEDGRFIKSAKGLPEKSYSAIHYNGNLDRACVVAKKKAVLIDVENDKVLNEFKIGPKNLLFVNPSLERILVFDMDRMDKVDVATNKWSPFPFDGVEPTHLSPDGTMLLCKREYFATGDPDTPLSFAYLVLDADTGETIFEIEDDSSPQRMPREVLFSNDSSTVIVKYSEHPNRESNNNAFAIWSVTEKKQLCEFGHDFSKILAYTSGYEKVLTFSSKGTQIFDGRKGTRLATLSPDFAQIDWAEFSNDGKYLMAQEVSNQRIPGKQIRKSRVSVWDAENGKLLFMLPEEGNHYVVRFTPDDRSFLTVNASHIVQNWPMNVLPGVQQGICREMTEAEWLRYSVEPVVTDSNQKLLNELDRMNHRIQLLGRLTWAKRNEASNLLDKLLGLWPEKPTEAQLDRIKIVLRQFHKGRIDVDPVVLEKVADGYSRLGEPESALILLEQAFRHRRNHIRFAKVEAARTALHPKMLTFQALENVGAFWDSGTDRYKEVKNWIESNDKTMLHYLAAHEFAQRKNYQKALDQLKLIDFAKLTEEQPVLLQVQCLKKLDKPKAAFDALTQALKNDHLQTQRLTMLWLVTGIHNLELEPEAMLKLLPKPSSLWLEESFVADARWLLEKLQDKESLSINCGADRDTTQNGKNWSRDRFHNSGFGYFESFGEARWFAGPIQETDTPFLFQTERWFEKESDTPNQGYSLPMPKGKYRVRLGFAEIYPSNRDFDVIVNGKPMIKNYDPGNGKDQIADIKEGIIEINSGLLDIIFKSNNSTSAKISFVEIIPLP